MSVLSAIFCLCVFDCCDSYDERQVGWGGDWIDSVVGVKVLEKCSLAVVWASSKAKKRVPRGEEHPLPRLACWESEDWSARTVVSSWWSVDCEIWDSPRKGMGKTRTKQGKGN